jgi:hypothetical protein
MEVCNMEYGDLNANEFRDDESELNNQLVYVEDAMEQESELSNLIKMYR